MDVIQDIMNKMSSMLSLAGCFRPVRSLIDRDKIIKDLVRFVVIDRIWLPLEQYVSDDKNSEYDQEIPQSQTADIPVTQ